MDRYMRTHLTVTHTHTHKDTRGLYAAVGLHKAQPVKLGTASWTQHTHYSLPKTKLYPPHSAPYHPNTNYRMPRHLPSRQLSAWVAESGRKGDWDNRQTEKVRGRERLSNVTL